MFSPKADAPLNVHVPSPGQDHPAWMKVGVITAIGFLAGVAWPRLAGVRLGPSVPETATASASAPASEGAPPAPERASQASAVRPPGQPSGGLPQTASGVAPVVVSAPAAAEPSAPPAAAGPGSVAVGVGHGAVFACKTTDGDSLKGGACGTLPGFDSLVMPRLRRLADCPEAAAASGTLHLIVHPDFARGSVGVELGRGQTVSAPDALLACAKADVGGANLASIAHDNPRYSVSYRVTFGGGAAAGATSAIRTDATPAPSSSHAQRAAEDGTAEGAVSVVWEVAVVRDAPRTGKVLARLPRGSTVRIGPAKDGWYPVKYGDGFSSEGWVFRGALGK